MLKQKLCSIEVSENIDTIQTTHSPLSGLRSVTIGYFELNRFKTSGSGRKTGVAKVSPFKYLKKYLFTEQSGFLNWFNLTRLAQDVKPE